MYNLEQLISVTFLFVKPLEDPKKTTDIVLEALKSTGQRGIIGRGWGNLGTCESLPFDSVAFFCFEFRWKSKPITSRSLPYNFLNIIQ